MHDVEPVFTGSAWAVGALSVVLTLAGLPLALTGIALSRLTKRRGIMWTSRWFRVFQVGFVIQVCSAVVTTVLSLTLVSLIFVVVAVGGGFALPAWLGLMAAVRPEGPPSLAR